MDDREFDERAEAVLQHIEMVLENGDVDCEVAPGGVLQLEFPDGSKMVINRHHITKELWVAARSGGFHFRWNGESWIDTRSGKELLEKLSSLISDQAGSSFRF